MSKNLKNKKYILRRAKNNRKREFHIGAATYKIDKVNLQKEANEYARKFLGYERMSVSAYINIKLILP